MPESRAYPRPVWYRSSPDAFHHRDQRAEEIDLILKELQHNMDDLMVLAEKTSVFGRRSSDKPSTGRQAKKHRG